MPIVYEYHKQDHTVQARVSGCLELDEVINYMNSLMNDPSVPSGFLEVVDFDEVTRFGFETSKIRIILDLYLKLKKSNQSIGTLFIASNPVAYGICRTLMGFYSGEGVMNVIRTRDSIQSTILSIRDLYPR